MLLFLRSGDRVRLLCTLGGGNFSCPIYVSRGSGLGHLGRFPSSVTFRAFLLSGSGGILTVKGPVLGPGVGRLCLGVVHKGSVMSATKGNVARAGIRVSISFLHLNGFS